MDGKKYFVLIITHKCNLNCKYCPTIKINESMNWYIAKKSIDLLNRLKSNDKYRIKFFGGEPLLEFDLIKKIVKYNKNSNKIFRYELTTNGILLTERKIEFFKKNNFELNVSIDGDKETQISERGDKAWMVFNKIRKENKRYVIVNIVCSPRKVHRFYDNFKFLFENGFQKFNLLPAFFNEWSDKQISLFDRELTKIAKFIKDKKIYIKNINIHKENYLFNNGYIIDYNGDIYNNDSIMVEHYRKFKRLLMLGNIKSIDSLCDVNDRNIILPPYKSDLINLKLDNSLSHFVELLKSKMTPSADFSQRFPHELM